MLHPGELVCGKYEIIKLIGRGGMSAVYQAKNLADGKLLAIKDVDRNGQESNKVVVQSMATEGEFLKRLDNHYLPKIYDVIEQDENFMLVMDYIEGESLDRVIAREGPQTEQNVYRWGMQICEVFDYLHNQNPPVVYRDMKPANVILRPDGNIMMIDFGTARTQKVDLVLQSDTVCIGTEGFAAPEQFGGISQSDARTDIFCLGATLYNLITGHSPSERPKGILPLATWNPQLESSPLNAVIQKCTRNDPNERYQSAMELFKDLKKASEGAFRNPSVFSAGALRKGEWQQQDIKRRSSAGGLSGLLGKSKILTKKEKSAEKPVSGDTVASKPDITMQEQPNLTEKKTEPSWQTIAPTKAEVPAGDAKSLWKTLTVCSGAGAVGFLVLSILGAALDSELMLYLMLIFVVASVVLALVGIVGWLKEDE